MLLDCSWLNELTVFTPWNENHDSAEKWWVSRKFHCEKESRGHRTFLLQSLPVTAHARLHFTHPPLKHKKRTTYSKCPAKPTRSPRWADRTPSATTTDSALWLSTAPLSFTFAASALRVSLSSVVTRSAAKTAVTVCSTRSAPSGKIRVQPLSGYPRQHAHRIY